MMEWLIFACRKAMLIGFADNMVVVIAKHPGNVVIYVSETIHAMEDWLLKVKLHLTDENMGQSLLAIARKRILSSLIKMRSF